MPKLFIDYLTFMFRRHYSITPQLEDENEQKRDHRHRVHRWCGRRPARRVHLCESWLSQRGADPGGEASHSRLRDQTSSKPFLASFFRNTKIYNPPVVPGTVGKSGGGSRKWRNHLGQENHSIGRGRGGRGHNRRRRMGTEPGRGRRKGRGVGHCRRDRHDWGGGRGDAPGREGRDNELQPSRHIHNPRR